MASSTTYSEVIRSKTSIANLQNNVGAVHRTYKDLSPRVLDGLEIMPPVSHLESLLFQVLLGFALQSLIISFQASHLLKVESQAVI